MSQIKHITVVNDSPEFLELLVELLSDEGYKVTAIPKHQGAFEQIKSSQPDLVICDLIFENAAHGWALIDMLHLSLETNRIPLLLCSAATQQVREVAPSLAAKGIRWLEKPFQIDDLLKVIAAIFDESTDN
jgi:CheY-like chemotaxis protein